MSTRAVLLLLTALALAGMIPARAIAQPAGAPTVFDVAPAHVYNSADSELTITGVGFMVTPVVTLSILDQKPLLLSEVRLADSTTLTATVPAATPEGVYTLVVYNPDGSHSEGAAQRLTVVRPGDERMSTWSETTPLDRSRANFATVAAAGNLYVLGGYSGATGGISQRLVQRATINADGSLGPWLPASPMITARGDFTAVAWHDYIYAVGGGMGAGLPAETGIERARVNPDGSLDPWERIEHMPYIGSWVAAVVVRDYLFVINGGAWDYRAHIAADGSLEQWEQVAATTGSSRTAAAWGPFIYAFNEHGSIERSAVQPDGSLEPWVDVGATAQAHSYGSIAVLDDTLLVIGGLIGMYPDQYVLTNVERALLRPDGSPDEWEAAPSLLSGHSLFGTAIWESQVYAVGDGSTRDGSRAVEFSRALELVLTERHFLPLLGAARR